MCDHQISSHEPFQFQSPVPLRPFTSAPRATYDNTNGVASLSPGLAESSRPTLGFQSNQPIHFARSAASKRVSFPIFSPETTTAITYASRQKSERGLVLAAVIPPVPSYLSHNCPNKLFRWFVTVLFDIVRDHPGGSVPSTILTLDSNFGRAKSSVSVTGAIKFTIKSWPIENGSQTWTELACLKTSRLRMTLSANQKLKTLDETIRNFSSLKRFPQRRWNR